MAEYSNASDKLSDSQLNKLKTAVKNKTGTTLRMNIKMFNGNNLPHELLSTTRQKAKLRNAFKNFMPTDIKLSKAQIFKIFQSGGFLGSLLSKLASPLMEVAVPFTKNILTPLGITVAGIQKKLHGSTTTTLIIPNEEMDDISKIVQALEDSNILLKEVIKTIKNETKKQEGGFLGMLLGTLGASLLRNLLTGKGIVRAEYGDKRVGYVLKKNSNTTSSFKKL